MHVDRIDPSFGHWFAGFADGEGCFYIGRVNKSNKGAKYVNYRCAFTISLRADDRAILELIRDSLGVGRVGVEAHDRTKRLPLAHLQIMNKADVLQLIDVFDRYPLRAKKARDFAIWRRAVIEWNSKACGGGRWNGSYDWSLMASLREELQEARKYSCC